MSRAKYPRFSIFIALLGLLAATLACGIGAARSAQPTVVVIFPPAGSSFTVGQEIIVQSVAADAKGIARVELWVDGQPAHTQAVAPAVTSYTASQPWKPTVVGSHIIEVRAYNVDNASSDPAQVIVTVAEAVAGATLTPMAANTPSGGNTPVPTTSAAGGGPIVTAVIGLNVRAGPGTEYPVIGGLSAGQSAQITGKNPEGTWWQIVYPLNSGGRGWVSADAKYSTASNAGGVLVVEVPLLPTYTPISTGTPTPTPLPTATPTPIPSATPIPAKPTIYTFTADRYTINAGESVVLHWDLANAKVAYLQYNGVQEGVVAPGTKTVSPATTTVYTLLAHNDAGDTTAQLTITVNPPLPPAVAVHSTGALDIPQTWTADLDEGVVGAGAADDIFFHAVTAVERYIEPINGATMAKVSAAPVLRSTCTAAPLSASKIHVNDLPEGTYVCVHTNQGRYSAFRVNAPIGPSPGTLKIGYTTWE